jgi:hypothetical protein
LSGYQIAGIAIACAAVLILSLGGLFHALFNNMGGNGSWLSASLGCAVFLGGIVVIVKLLTMVPLQIL